MAGRASMSDLATFFERLDQVVEDIEGNVDLAALVDDDVVEQRGEVLLPLFRQRAARAGVDVDDVVAAIRDRTVDTAHAVELRIAAAIENGAEVGASGQVLSELVGLATSAGLQFFLAGVMWEQDRQMPDLGETGP